MAREREDWRGKPVTVMGLGLFGGGAGSARRLAELGAQVTVTDLRTAEVLHESLESLADLDLRFVLGEHRAEDFARAALVVPNPAVRPENSWLELARESGARVASDVELFIEHCPAKLVAVTGTQGKTSTCSFVVQLLEAGGRTAYLGGNAGGSLWPKLGDMRKSDFVVLELSSYQLEALAYERGLQQLARFEAVAVTNVAGDHLERHGTLERYEAAKRTIVELVHETGVVFVRADDAAARWNVTRGRRVEFGPGAELHVRNDEFRRGETALGQCAAIDRLGRFQRENALLALGLVHELGVDPKSLSAAVPDLRAPDHRMQDLGIRAGLHVFDNNASTTPDSTTAAFESLEGTCVWICGGQLKDLPLAGLIEAARSHVERAICFGEAGPLLAEALETVGIDVSVCPDLRRAMKVAFDEGPPKSKTLLFSPACASFDAYPNVAARASDFAALLPPPGEQESVLA